MIKSENGEFAIIKSQTHLNSYKINVQEWSNKTNAIRIVAKQEDVVELMYIKI